MSNHHQISPTAWLVAKLRSEFTDIPYCEEIEKEAYQKVNSSLMKIAFKILKIFSKIQPAKVVGLATIEGRYKSINDTLPKDNNFFLVEMAAGLSPRCLQYAANGSIAVETDLPWMIELKHKVLENIYEKGPRPENHHLSTLNAMHREEFDTIGKFYQKHGKNKPIYVVHEGMAMYFNTEEKETFRNNIAYFLRKYAPGKGYWVTTDFSNFKKAQEQKVYSSPMKLVRALLEKISKRKIEDFKTPEQVEKFLSKSKLKGKKINNSHLIKDFVTLKRMNQPPAAAKDILEQYVAILIQPEEQMS